MLHRQPQLCHHQRAHGQQALVSAPLIRRPGPPGRSRPRHLLQRAQPRCFSSLMLRQCVGRLCWREWLGLHPVFSSTVVNIDCGPNGAGHSGISPLGQSRPAQLGLSRTAPWLGSAAASPLPADSTRVLHAWQGWCMAPAEPHLPCHVAPLQLWWLRQRAALGQLGQPPACLLRDIQVGFVDGRTLHHCL